MRSRYSRWKAPKAEPFESEAALCELLRERAKAQGWVAYPETGGWDLVLVLPDETQIGVQAKLRANVDVLAQTLVDHRRAGPSVHAVLVPTCSRAFEDVARHLNVAVLVGAHLRIDANPPKRFWEDSLVRVVSKAPRCCHAKALWLPPFVPDLPAGVPSPKVVSRWRVEAAKLCAELRQGLEPTVAQLKERHMSISTWRSWLTPIPGTRPRRYRLNPLAKLPDFEFPEVSLGLGLPDPRERKTP